MFHMKERVPYKNKMAFSVVLYENWLNRRNFTIAGNPLHISLEILKRNSKNFCFLFLIYFFLVTLIHGLNIILYSGIFTDHDKIQNIHALTTFPSNFVVILLLAIPRLMVFRLVSNIIRREDHKLIFSDILQIKQYLNYNLYFKELSFLFLDHILSDFYSSNNFITSALKYIIIIIFNSIFGYTEFFFIEDPQIPLIHCYQWSFICFQKLPLNFIVFGLIVDITKRFIITVPLLFVFEAVMFYRTNGTIKKEE